MTEDMTGAVLGRHYRRQRREVGVAAAEGTAEGPREEEGTAAEREEEGGCSCVVRESVSTHVRITNPMHLVVLLAH